MFVHPCRSGRVWESPLCHSRYNSSNSNLCSSGVVRPTSVHFASESSCLLGCVFSAFDTYAPEMLCRDSGSKAKRYSISLQSTSLPLLSRWNVFVSRAPEPKPFTCAGGSSDFEYSRAPPLWGSFLYDCARTPSAKQTSSLRIGSMHDCIIWLAVAYVGHVNFLMWE